MNMLFWNIKAETISNTDIANPKSNLGTCLRLLASTYALDVLILAELRNFAKNHVDVFSNYSTLNHILSHPETGLGFRPVSTSDGTDPKDPTWLWYRKPDGVCPKLKNYQKI